MAHHLSVQNDSKVILLKPFKFWRVSDRPFSLNPILENCKHVQISRDTRFRVLRGLQRVNHILLQKIHISLPLLSFRKSDSELSSVPGKHLKRMILTGFYLDFLFSREVVEIVASEAQSYLMKFTPRVKSSLSYGVVHVRRGDFDLDNFGWLSSEFYVKALHLMPKVDELILLTDSPDLIEDVHSATGIQKIYGPNVVGTMEALSILAKAKFVIGSNSTFSWWGATLCGLNGGMSILPNRWFKSDSTEVYTIQDSKMLLLPPIWLNNSINREER
jgi:hypothetical protein